MDLRFRPLSDTPLSPLKYLNCLAKPEVMKWSTKPLKIYQE
jgi:hypothetical protein